MMKKVIALSVVALFVSATFAQDYKSEQKSTTTTQTTADKSSKNEFYEMKDNTLIHSAGSKSEAQKTTVTLKNGTTITPSGEVKMKDGATVKLENGQCISLMGSIGDCAKMREASKQKAEGEPVQAPDPMK